MSTRTLILTPTLLDYIHQVSLRDLPILAELRAETAKLPLAIMQIAPEQGQFMGLITRLIGAKRILEIGTFTGYSALVMALNLPPAGRVITCDINPETTSMARKYWAKAGVAEKIELKLGPALATLDQLLADPNTAPFDAVFIDADKENYDAYFERALRLTREGGLIMIDNVLWSGAVADPAKTDRDTVALRALNAKLHRDERIDLSLLPIADGLTLARKR